ncbi:MAG: galactitol-1-phosphate 5-dehydrogenase [Lachnospiraceae bacterium]|nr:galactitol-1-phosphate 5-dehydrogenase [Lachnospiraceae bacterium]
MKAYVLNGIADITYGDADTPSHDGSGIVGRNGQTSVSEDECVIVKVRAAGVCGSDIPRIYKTGAYHHPLIPGHEFSGEVVSSGSESLKSFIGKRVGIFPLIPCGKCSSCKKKLYEMCTDYNYLGSRCDGGFAEYVKVPASNLIELPDNVSYEQAAMLEPISVSMHSIRQCGLYLEPGEEERSLNIVISGMGTIGLFTLMLLRGMGYRNIFCIGNKDSQAGYAKLFETEAGETCNIKNDDPVIFASGVTKGEGADVFFECAGKNESVSLGLNVLGGGGRLQLVGNPASDMSFPKEEYWKILRKQLKVTGTWNSSFTGDEDDDWHLVLKALEEGKIKPEKLISHRLKFEDLKKGFELMRDKTEDYVKVMALL